MLRDAIVVRTMELPAKVLPLAVVGRLGTIRFIADACTTSSLLFSV
jgi:hypothetical protein